MTNLYTNDDQTHDLSKPTLANDRFDPVALELSLHAYNHYTYDKTNWVDRIIFVLFVS